ncbi:hypothetical protein C7293_03195 [filamentous cyanobacterium CCT1]|nr:hypothetical protein C7293_03195 [filamentous cyanobacterium CCT1]PSN81365.1 hypothetical protein C8B47_01730 [filamentous cyanobacterium CCP4]
MKLVVHKDDDALYLRLDDTAIVEFEEVSDGIILDYNADGKVVGIEMLYVSQRSPNSWQQIFVSLTISLPSMEA